MARRASPLRQSGRFETEGRRLLVHLLNNTARLDIARACHVSEAGVGMWVCGVARPDLDAALLLQRRYGITMSSWALPPNANPICVETAILIESRPSAA